VNETRIVVLGAGPAGLAAALELAERGVSVRVLERQDRVGGNAGSFEFAGVRVDYGSHRLHPAADPEILERLRQLLGDDLLTRPRHGRIRLMGRWLHFPLRPADLALRAHPRFALGVGLDLAGKLLPRPGSAGPESFASVLQRGLGATICREFYFPYARKIWGVEPEALSAIQARKRVSAGSLGKMLRRLLPGGTGSGAANTKGVFYYPRRGYGQISEALHEAALAAGAQIELTTQVERIDLSGSRPRVHWVCDGQPSELEAHQVFSTIPVSVLARLCEPQAPASVLAAADALEFRAMILVYLALEQDRFTEFDAHYFPEAEFPFSRVSEPKNYAALPEPRGRTVLCAEIPCQRGDALWTLSDEELSLRVRDGLERAGLPVRSEVGAVLAKRIPFAYPIYHTGYDTHFGALDRWLDERPGVLSFGRQGLYAHDNTHHAMFMARSAVRCLRSDGSIDRDAWHAERAIFETHVVED
jgi:protoporphyrinogen oxidase